MIIKKHKIINFRNIQNLNLEFDDSINIFLGNNGTGKTNIVESIAYLSLFKSLRSSDTESLIKYGCDFASIEAYDDNNNIYKIVLSNEGKKITINNKPIKKHSDFTYLFNIVTFTPDDAFLFKNNPRNRRDVINDQISNISPSYEYCLNEYNKLRMDRNKILEQENIDEALVKSYDVQLASYAERICKKRNEFINDIQENLTNYYQSISDTQSVIRIEYVSEFKDLDRDRIVNYLSNHFNEDLIRKQTINGPHKDDYICYLDDKDISEIGSQGQNRLAVISLKLAFLAYIKEAIGKDGIVILDDVLSELDNTKKTKLLNELLNKSQVFITGTEDIKDFKKAHKFYINQGSVKGERYYGRRIK